MIPATTYLENNAIKGNEDENSMHIELQFTDSTGAVSMDEASTSVKVVDSDMGVGHDDEDPMLAEREIASIHEQPGETSAASPAPPQTALVRKLLSMRQQRRKLSARQRVAIAIGTIPVVVCSLEMIPDRCHICRENMELDAYFFSAAICGGFAAVIYGDSLDYWMPRLLGGSISALGSLFTNWMLLTSIPTNLAFLFVFVGILGAMPGVVIYFLLKVVSDECFESDVDDYDEIAPLTKIRITSAD